jgi:hypothetical protein
MQNLLAGKIEQLPIDEAEKKIAQHRNISKFEWMENFADEEARKFFSGKIIDPNKIALCYFGEDIGYGVVAVELIKQGELLIFTGQFCDKLTNDNLSNPYLSIIPSIDTTPKILDAKEHGGFSSMLMDLPSEIEVSNFRTQFNSQVELAQSNFDFSYQEISEEKIIIVLTANRDIQANELLGASYTPSTRLAYADYYVGFNNNGERHPSSINNQLRKSIYDTFIYHLPLSKEDPLLLLLKVIENFNKSNMEQAISYLMQHLPTLKELTDNQLESLQKYLIQKKSTAGDNGNTTSEGKSDRLVMHANLLTQVTTEQEARKSEERKFSRQQICQLFIKSNQKQIELRNSGKRELFLPSIGLYCRYDFIYPEIHKNHFTIGKHLEEQKYFALALYHYEFSIHYAKKFNDNNFFDDNGSQTLLFVAAKNNNFQDTVALLEELQKKYANKCSKKGSELLGRTNKMSERDNDYCQKEYFLMRSKSVLFRALIVSFDETILEKIVELAKKFKEWGGTLFKENKIDASEKYYEISLNIFLEIFNYSKLNPDEIIKLYSNLVLVALKKLDFDKAITRAETALLLIPTIECAEKEKFYAKLVYNKTSAILDKSLKAIADDNPDKEALNQAREIASTTINELDHNKHILKRDLSTLREKLRLLEEKLVSLNQIENLPYKRQHFN